MRLLFLFVKQICCKWPCISEPISGYNWPVLTSVVTAGRDVKCPNAEEVVYTLKDKKCYEQIERAYSYASKLLLDLLIEEKELLARIRYGSMITPSISEI